MRREQTGPMYSCSFFAAHAKFIDTPASLTIQRQSPGVSCIPSLCRVLFPSNGAPNAVAFSSAAKCHLKAWLASRLAQTSRHEGAALPDEVERRASWLWRGCRAGGCYDFREASVAHVGDGAPHCACGAVRKHLRRASQGDSTKSFSPWLEASLHRRTAPHCVCFIYSRTSRSDHRRRSWEVSQ